MFNWLVNKCTLTKEQYGVQYEGELEGGVICKITTRRFDKLLHLYSSFIVK